MIKKEEVEHIAKLARLELTTAEVEKMQKDLSAILDYFVLLKGAPKVKGQSVPLENTKVWGRIDEVRPRDVKMAERLIAAAPEKKDGCIKVKAIL